MATTFRLGSISLPDDVGRIAEDVCADHGLTPMELFCKWEAWSLAQQKSTDVPTADDLQALSAHIRAKAAKAARPTTPSSSARKRHSPSHPSPSPLYSRPSPTPTRINVDDFFSYVEDAPPAPPNSAAPPDDADIEDTQPVDLDGDATPNAPATPLKRRAASPLRQPDFGASPRAKRAPPAVSQPSAFNLPGDDKPDALYARRAGAARVETTFAGPLHAAEPREPAKLALRVRASADPDQRYMNDALPARAEAARARIQALGNAILSNLTRAAAAKRDVEPGTEAVDSDGASDGLPPCTPESFTVASPNRVLAIGRVRADPAEPDAGGTAHINAASVQLESAEGHVLSLDLTRLRNVGAHKPFFLCAGMVVVVDGVNTNGRVMDVHAVHDNALEPLPATVPDAPAGRYTTSAPPVVRMLAAAGPFSTQNNLLFEPLSDLLAVVRRTRPHLLLLSGPFLNLNHKLVGPATPVPFGDVLRDRVVQPLLAMLRELKEEDASGTVPLVVLQPSLDDACAAFVAPQPPLQISGLDDEAAASVRLVGNPAVLEVSGETNERPDDDDDEALMIDVDGTGGERPTRRTQWRATVALSGLPIVQDVAHDSVMWNSERFSAIAGCVVRQRCVYPLVGGSGVPIDSGLADKLALPASEETRSVDLVVMPSRVKAFAKGVDDGVLAVNPGPVCRGAGGGTYAQVELPLHRRGERRDVAHVTERAAVNIVRL